MIVAELDPVLPREEQLWWMGQLRQRVNVLGWHGSPAGLTSVRVQAPRDQLEAVARRLLTAIDEANAAYPEHYAAWRREHDDRIAGERLRQQGGFATQQAVLDRLMDEYHSKQ